MMKKLALLLALFTACPVWAVGPVPFDVINLTTGIRIGGAATSGQYLRGNGTNFVSAAILAGDLPAGFVDNVADVAAGLCSASQVLKKNAGNTAWECAADGGGGDSISVNGTAATDANFLDTAASGTVTPTTFTLATGPDPDTVALTIGNASATQAGAITTGAQTIAGAKTFSSAPLISTLTSGRVVLAGASGVLADSANLTFDQTNFRLRVQNATTATDNTTNMFQLSGTMPTTPTATVQGVNLAVTSAGSAAQSQEATRITLSAGYTGSSSTTGVVVLNTVAGAGATLGLGGTTIGNFGLNGNAQGSGAGITIGSQMAASNSTTMSIGGLAKAVVGVAGSNFGLIANAANSGEGADFGDVALLATLASALPTPSAGGIDVALVVDNGAGADKIAEFYDNGSLVGSIDDGGALVWTTTITSSRTTDLGWTPVNAANQACNTTCTSACVTGIDTAAVGNFLACTDATADSCLCAGAS